MSPKLKALCWRYIEAIDEADDAARRDLHNDILGLTGLSSFEFGGLPFWFEIESVDTASTRLYEALLRAMKGKHGDKDAN